MNSVLAVLFKNLTLLVILVVCLIFIFTLNIGYAEINYILIFLALLYVSAAFIEAYQLAKINTSAQVFNYFTDGFLFKQLIKIIILAGVGVMLVLSKGLIKYLSFVCFLIALTDIFILLWRCFTNRYFIALIDDYVIVSLNKIVTVKLSSISKIEERHGLTYIVTLQNKTITLRTDTMRNGTEFKQVLYKWATEKGIGEKYFKES